MRSIFLAFFLFACSGGSSTSTSTSSTEVDVDMTGHWNGSLTSSVGLGASFTADLTQSGASVTGSVRMTGGCVGGGKITGTVSGDRFDGGFVAGDVTATLTLTESSPNQLDGTFSMPAAGACEAQQGSVSLVRR